MEEGIGGCPMCSLPLLVGRAHPVYLLRSPGGVGWLSSSLSVCGLVAVAEWGRRGGGGDWWLLEGQPAPPLCKHTPLAPAGMSQQGTVYLVYL